MSWVKLHSRSAYSDVFRDAELWRFWCYLLMRTSRNGNDFQLGRHQVTVLPGECVIGRKHAAIDCCTTEQRVRTMLKRLEKMGNLTIKPTKIATIITISNWATYQKKQPSKQPTEQPATNQQTTIKQPATNHYLEGLEVVEVQKKRKKKRKGARVSSNTPDMVLIGSLVNRRPNTLWTVDEKEALDALGDITGDISALMPYYKSDDEYKRRTVMTLLNNWNGELDKAENYKPQNSGDKI